MIFSPQLVSKIQNDHCVVDYAPTADHLPPLHRPGQQNLIAKAVKNENAGKLFYLSVSPRFRDCAGHANNSSLLRILSPAGACFGYTDAFDPHTSRHCVTWIGLAVCSGETAL
jgi:hypothetical protein